MSLLDAGVGTLANQAMNYLVSGEPPGRLGNAHPNIVPYQTFATRDGHIVVAVGNDVEPDARAELSENRPQEAQIGQSILPRQLPILGLQFVRQSLDFIAQRLVGLLQAKGDNRPPTHHACPLASERVQRGLYDAQKAFDQLGFVLRLGPMGERENDVRTAGILNGVRGLGRTESPSHLSRRHPGRCRRTPCSPTARA